MFATKYSSSQQNVFRLNTIAKEVGLHIGLLAVIWGLFHKPSLNRVVDLALNQAKKTLVNHQYLDAAWYEYHLWRMVSPKCILVGG